MIPKVGIDQYHYYFDNKTSSPSALRLLTHRATYTRASSTRGEVRDGVIQFVEECGEPGRGAINATRRHARARARRVDF